MCFKRTGSGELIFKMPVETLHATSLRKINKMQPFIVITLKMFNQLREMQRVI